MRQWTPYEKTQLLRAGRADLLEKTVDVIPVEYLLGQVNFCGWDVKVSPSVLIPRVETEDLVEYCFDEVKTQWTAQKQLTVVEVGTGSGAIGLSLWRKLVEIAAQQRVQLTLLDVSHAALVVAKNNLETAQREFGSNNTPQIQQMDLLNDWPTDKKIDLLIANLPYIPTERLQSLDASVIDYEPRLALDGGEDGLVLIKKLLQQSERLLSETGVIWLEVDDSHTLEKFNALNLPFQYQTMLDCFDKPRFIRVIRHGRETQD